MSDQHKTKAAAEPGVTQPAAALLATLFQQTCSAEELQSLLHDQQSRQALFSSLSTQVVSLLQDEEEENPSGQALSGLKISNYEGKDVLSAPDRLRGTAAENKAVFDRLVKEIVAPTLNAVIDVLQSAEGAAEIGFAAENEELNAEEFAARTVSAALAELYRRSYSKQENDQQLQDKEDRYRAAYEALFDLLHRDKGAPASIAGVAHAAGDIDLVGGEGITISPDPAGKLVKITATGEAVMVPHARGHELGGIDELTAEIAYDNTDSALLAQTVQEAVDELASLPSDVPHVFSDLDDLQVHAGILVNASSAWNQFVFPAVNGVAAEFDGIPSVTATLLGGSVGFVQVQNITTKGFQYRVLLLSGGNAVATANALEVAWQAIYDGGWS